MKVVADTGAAAAFTPAERAAVATPLLPIFRPPRGPDELGWPATYRVLKQLGEGGTGLVFLAEDSQLQQQVALQVMRPQLAASATQRERFLREARSAAIIIRITTPDGKKVDIEVPDGSQITILPDDKPKPAKPVDEAWIEEVAAMEPEKQVEAVAAKLKELNPGFGGKVGKIENGEIEFEIRDGKVTDFKVPTDQLADISPVRALPGLKHRYCLPMQEWTGTDKLTNLWPLKGLSLRALCCSGNPALNDLTPLTGSKLEVLMIHRTGVADLAVLKDLPHLEMLNCAATSVRDLSPVAGLRLTSVACVGTKGSDLSPLKGMKVTSLEINGAPVEDLSLLADMPLEKLAFDYRPARDAELSRKPTLKTINGKPADVFRKEAEGK